MLWADNFFVFQDRITEIFNQKKSAVVRVFGYHAAPSDSCNPNEAQQVDVGTGFFISREGHIMTIANVVNEAQCIWAEYNGIPCPADLVGYDNITNLAIVRLSRSPLNISFLHLGEAMEIPQPSVMLLGITCKLGNEPGPSMGMVTGWHTAFFDKAFPTTYLRSNIPSDGGEGGSPVFDLTGRFVGVMVISIDGIRSSFIIPARAVMRVRDDLVFSGKVSYAFLGIELDKEASLASGCLIIGKAIDGGPAHEAGLKSGDKILEFDNTLINHVMDLHNATFFARPGQLISIKVQRGDKELKLSVRLREQPALQVGENVKSVERNQSATVVQSDSKSTKDVPKEIEAITQKNDRWRNRFISE